MANRFASARNPFAADTPDPELGEPPGTCAHFIVDREGTIYLHRGRLRALLHADATR